MKYIHGKNGHATTWSSPNKANGLNWKFNSEQIMTSGFIRTITLQK